jgi:pimeloyl-ACP methyl ester carboxylesterase
MIWTWILMCVQLAIAESVTLNTPFMGDFVIEEDGKGKRAVIFVHGENETGAHMSRLSDFFASRKLRTVHFDLAGSGERSNEDAVYPFMHLEVQAIIKHLRADGVRDVQCIGSGFGAILCMQAISETTPLSQIGIINPVHTKFNQSLFSNIDAYPKLHPIFVIMGSDTNGEHCLARLEEHRNVLLFTSSSRKPGMELLITHPDLEEHLRDWVWKKIPDRKAPPIDMTHETTLKGEPLPF